MSETEVVIDHLRSCAERIGQLQPTVSELRTKAQEAEVDDILFGALGHTVGLAAGYHGLANDIHKHLAMLVDGLAAAREKLVVTADQYEHADQTNADLFKLGG